MAKDLKKVQAKSGEAARRAANLGVKHGTVRMGKGGRTRRMWNSRSARWERVSSYKPKQSVTSRSSANRGPAADFVVRNVSPSSSSGSAWTSTGGAGSSKRRVTRRTSGGGRASGLSSNFFSTRFRGRSGSNPVR